MAVRHGREAWEKGLNHFLEEVDRMRRTGEINDEDFEAYQRGSGALTGFLAGVGYGIEEP